LIISILVLFNASITMIESKEGSSSINVSKVSKEIIICNLSTKSSSEIISSIFCISVSIIESELRSKYILFNINLS